MASGIRDKVAILGMGCSRFGERWNDNAEDLMVESFQEALADAGIEKDRIEAAWLATAIEEQHVGKSGVPLAIALRLDFIPVTRVENYCASGSEAFRGAVYAVAAGACDIALALGVEKLKDTGYGGLPQRTRGMTNDMFYPNLSAPGMDEGISCVACHSRRRAPTAPLGADFLQPEALSVLPLGVRAELQTATRRFRPGLASWRALAEERLTRRPGSGSRPSEFLMTRASRWVS